MSYHVFAEAVALLGSRINTDYVQVGTVPQSIEVCYGGTAGSVVVLIRL